MLEIVRRAMPIFRTITTWGLVIGVSYLFYIGTIESKTFQTVLETKNQEIELLRLHDESIAIKLKEKQIELETKKQELDKISQDLSTKTKELATVNKKVQDQESQLSSNAAELSKLRDRPPLFTFNVASNLVQDVDRKKADVKQLVTDAYDMISSIYSKPYLLASVTITFVESFTNPKAAAEIVIENDSEGLKLTIKIKDFDKNNFNDISGIVHEITHSFHGVVTLEPVAYEEGITVAATDAVLAELIAQKKIPSFNPLYIRINADDYRSSSLSLPVSTVAFYNSDDTAMYYQLAGYGWWQLYKQDKNFFKTFNEALYTKKRDGNEITSELTRQLISSSISGSVEGVSVSDWLQTKAFSLK